MAICFRDIGRDEERAQGGGSNETRYPSGVYETETRARILNCLQCSVRSEKDKHAKTVVYVCVTVTARVCVIMGHCV